MDNNPAWTITGEDPLHKAVNKKGKQIDQISYVKAAACATG